MHNLSRHVGGTDAYALPLDNLLGLTAPQVRVYLALMALLYNSTIVSDSWAFTNAGLIEVLRSSPDGQELLTQGVLRIALRDSVDDFAAVEREFRVADKGKPIHGLAGDAAYASFLDTHTRDHRISFPRKQVGANYKRMMEQVLNEEFLTMVGVSPEASAMTMRIINAAKRDGTYVDSNTFIKEVVQPQIPNAGDQQLVMDTARAPYSLNLPTLLGTGVQGPENYTGDRILRLMGGTQTAGSVNVIAAPLTVVGAFTAVIGDASVRWLFSSDALGALTAEDIVAARTMHESDRQSYLAALESFLGKPSSEVWLVLVGCMQTYFAKAAQVVLDRWAASSRLANEPIGTPVQVDASGASLKILLDKPMQFSGIDTGASSAEPRTLELAAPEAVQLIGRTLSVPVSTVDEKQV